MIVTFYGSKNEAFAMGDSVLGFFGSVEGDSGCSLCLRSEAVLGVWDSFVSEGRILGMWDSSVSVIRIEGDGVRWASTISLEDLIVFE